MTKQELEEVKQEAEEAKLEVEVTKQELEEVKQEAEEAKREAELEKQHLIQVFVETLKECGLPYDIIKEKVAVKFAVDMEYADKKI